MKHRLLLLLIFLVLISSVSFGQIQYSSFGGYVGLGTIRGNSAPVTSAGANLYIDLVPWFSDGSVSIRAGFLYAQKVEKFIPENRLGRYYPFIKSFSLKGVLKQLLNSTFYLEQGAGLIALNDRTFVDTNTWEAGASFNALAGADLRSINSSGVSIGLGLDYGITFTGTTASYYLIYAQIQYYP